MPTKTKSVEYVVKPAPKTYTGLKNILILKLKGINGQDGGDLFSGVYGVSETNPEGYPCAFVIEKTGGGSILDTHRNEREWQFSVVIHQGIHKGITPETAYSALLDAADRVITSFDQDPMLKDSNGQERCKWVKVVPASFEYASQEVAVHRCLLNVAIVDVVNRYATP